MAGAHGVEAVVAVGEMAEAVVGALEWRHERKVAKDVSREWDWAEVESDLDIQRRENERLRATIHMYEQAFQELHKQKLESGKVSVDRSMAVISPIVYKPLEFFGFFSFFTSCVDLRVSDTLLGFVRSRFGRITWIRSGFERIAWIRSGFERIFPIVCCGRFMSN
jgi:hypothetical protein